MRHLILAIAFIFLFAGSASCGEVQQAQKIVDRYKEVKQELIAGKISPRKFEAYFKSLRKHAIPIVYSMNNNGEGLKFPDGVGVGFPVLNTREDTVIFEQIFKGTIPTSS